MPEGTIKFKFADYHNSEGVKEVILNEGEGVEPSAAREETGKGRSLEDLLASAKTVGLRTLDDAEVVVESKRATVGNEASAADTERKAEDGVKKYRGVAEGVILDFKRRLNEEFAGETKLSGKAFFILDQALEHMLDVSSNDESVELMNRMQDSSLEDSRAMVIEELERLAGNMKAKETKKAVNAISRICRELLGIDDKAGNEPLPEEISPVPCGGAAGMSLGAAAAEFGRENREHGERRGLVEMLFQEIFDKENFKGRHIEVEGEDRPRSLYMVMQGASYAGGPIERMKDEFMERMGDDMPSDKEELKKEVLLFCQEHAAEYSQRSKEPKRMEAALLSVCEDGLGAPVAAGEKSKEIAEGEFEKMELEISGLVDAYEDKIRNGRDNNLYGEKTDEAVAWQRRKLAQAMEGIGEFLKRYEGGERSAELLECYRKHKEDMANLKDELFADLSGRLDLKAAKNAGIGRGTEEKEALKEGKGGEVPFDEYARRIKWGEEWRMRDIAAGKKVPPLMKNEKFKGLAEKQIVELKEMVAEGQKRLDAAVAEKEALEKGNEPVGWREEFATAAEKIEAVDEKTFGTLKVKEFENFDVKEAFAEAVKEDWSSQSNIAAALEIAKKVNDPAQTKRLVVFDGRTYVVEGVAEAEPAGHHDEEVDKHYEMMPGISKEEQEFLLEMGKEDAQALLKGFEEKKYFKEYVSDEVKKEAVRLEMKLRFIEILHDNFHELDETKIEAYADKLAKETV